jgi:hypothetical protein
MSVEEDIKALENPGRWEVRALPDGTRRLIFWTQGNEAASWMTMSEAECRALAAALVNGLPNTVVLKGVVR